MSNTTNTPKITASKSALKIDGLTVSYGDKTAIFSVDANFPAAAMSAIIGPNGAGKSTLLKAVIGVQPKLSGQIHILNNPIENNLKKIAYVPQRVSVDWDFPTNVIDVVQMGLYRQVGLLGRMKGKHASIAMECLDRVGMADLWQKQTGQGTPLQWKHAYLSFCQAIQPVDRGPFVQHLLHLLESPNQHSLFEAHMQFFLSYFLLDYLIYVFARIASVVLQLLP
jgi:ABC-type hemin transport system ATPase subunit